MRSHALLLNSKDDLDWLYETYLKNYSYLHDCVKSFIIIGNEDAPELIELYADTMPFLGQLPIALFKKGILTT